MVVTNYFLILESLFTLGPLVISPNPKRPICSFLEDSKFMQQIIFTKVIKRKGPKNLKIKYLVNITPLEMIKNSDCDNFPLKTLSLKC